ncbi:MAG TPA: surface-adhesin E family protein [Allosphingosinicella sp.]|jgi:hypothetical protein
MRFPICATGAALLTVLLTPIQAGAQPRQPEAIVWTPLASDAESELFYDPQSVERVGGAVAFRLRARPRDGLFEPVGSVLARVEIDCAAQTSAILTAEAFDAAGARLDIATPGANGAHQPIFAGSAEEEMYRGLCPRDLVRPLPSQYILVDRSSANPDQD